MIVTLQEQRQRSERLTLSYNRTLDVVEDSKEHRRLRGHKLTVHEDEYGIVTIHHDGHARPRDAHPKDDAREPFSSGSPTGSTRETPGRIGNSSAASVTIDNFFSVSFAACPRFSISERLFPRFKP
jgi:hypothetical protein